MKILVVGDLMLDHYVAGVVERQSPEASIPILKQTNEWWSLGGAGNVAANLASLGAETWFVTSMGKDSQYARIITDLLQEKNIHWSFVISEQTTTKTRFVIKGTYEPMLRVDTESIKPINMFRKASPFWPDITEDLDVVIVSDYAKGVVTKRLMEEVRTLDVPIIVDPKPVNAHLYKDVYMICPNAMECDRMIELFPAFLEDLNYGYIIKTCGRRGLEVFDTLRKHHTIIPSEEINVVDVCGAGDTVTAVMAVCKAMNMDILKSAEIACRCAEYVVTQPGTITIPREKFEEYLT